MPAVGFLEQLRVGLQGGRESCFDGHEEQYEIQALQAFETLIVLQRQAFEVVAQRLHMLLQRQRAAALVLRTGQHLIGGQTHLGVHHHLLIARQLDQHVRLEALAARTLEADLGVVLAPFFQPRMLEHPLENQLAPVALGLLPLQGAGQVGRLVTQTLVELL